jgi:hypothetical protein
LLDIDVVVAGAREAVSRVEEGTNPPLEMFEFVWPVSVAFEVNDDKVNERSGGGVTLKRLVRGL